MKRHLLTAGGGLLGIFLTMLLLESGASTIENRQNSTATPGFDLETPDMTDLPDFGGDGETGDGQSADSIDESLPVNPPGSRAPDMPIRGIAPEQFALPQDVTTQPLERIEPRMPLSEPDAEPQPVPTVLRHPVALSAGLIDFDGRLLQLEGLVPQKPDRVCGEQGRSWPCGTVARTAFRNFLRARALVCLVQKNNGTPKNSWQGTLITSCTVNAVDPAGWLAENGWAEASAGSPLAAKIDAARQSGLGFFGEDPRDFSVTPVPLDDSPVQDSTGTEGTGAEGMDMSETGQGL